MNERDNQEAERAAPELLPRYAEAVAIVKEQQRASVSLVQRRLRISWNDARDLVELMLSRRDVPLDWATQVYQLNNERRAPAVGEDGLPPLPQPMRKVYKRPHGVQELLYYTAGQYRQGQRDAVAADRRERDVTVTDYGNPVDNLPTLPPLNRGTREQQLEAVARAGCDDLMRLHEALGFANDDVIDADKMIERIADLRAQLALKSEVPNGFAVVPIEPTKEMAIAGAMASENSHDETQDSYESYAIWDDAKVAYECFKAMLAAAPGKENT